MCCKSIKLAYFSNYLNHHQVALADELYKILGDSYRFIATSIVTHNNLKGGEDYSTRPYCVLAKSSASAQQEAIKLARYADVCVFGACSQEYAIERAKYSKTALSFEMGERWLKRGWINIFSPNCMSWMKNYWRYYHKSNFHKLCMSGFAARDDRRLGCYKGRHFKWGYFTTVVEQNTNTRPINDNMIKILWCARFLKLKHPELVIQLADKLKNQNASFHIDLIGDGIEKEKTIQLSQKYGLGNFVSFLGSMPNQQVLEKMRLSDIFLFTSDKNEGWGAVINEAMSQRCIVISSDTIGCTPFLIEEGKNGLLFKCNDIESLLQKVQWVLDHPEKMESIKEEAYKTISEIWSPRNAANNLLKLISDLQDGRGSSIINGPCSVAAYE